jgi:hypothetical protein
MGGMILIVISDHLVKCGADMLVLDIPWQGGGRLENLIDQFNQLALSHEDQHRANYHNSFDPPIVVQGSGIRSTM